MYPIKFLCAFLFILFSNQLIAKAPGFSPKELNHPPGRTVRTCCAFGSDLRIGLIPFFKLNMVTSTELIGMHHYLGSPKERNGIIYTRRGGFIDLGHLRDHIDWTVYFYEYLKNNRSAGRKSIHLGYEGGSKLWTFNIPDFVTDDELIILAQNSAYNISVYHEITTWFGSSTIPFVPERYSSFSLEDLYSNMLGTIIAGRAIKSELPFEEAVSEILRQTLSDLEAVSSKAETFKAMEDVRNIWWTRKPHIPSNKITIRREVGLCNNLSPLIVPQWKSSNPVFQISLPETICNSIPVSEFYELIVDLNHKLPFKKIFPGRIERKINQNDFPEILKYISSSMEKMSLIVK